MAGGRAIAAAAFAVAIGHLAAAQHAGSYTPADVENGARLFGQHCSTCHGADGDMVPTANLRKGEFRRGSSDEDLMRTISNGVPGTAMNGHNFNPAELGAIVAYLRSMRDFGARAVAVGDAPAGRALFEGKACLSCHRVNGQGSLMAADLSDVGAIRSAEALERALTGPDRDRSRGTAFRPRRHHRRPRRPGPAAERGYVHGAAD